MSPPEPIKKLGGRIDSSQGWGRRKLAFRIAKQTEGYYHLMRFTAPTDRVAEMKRLFSLNEAIVRFVILSENGAEVLAGAQPAST